MEIYYAYEKNLNFQNVLSKYYFCVLHYWSQIISNTIKGNSESLSSFSAYWLFHWTIINVLFLWIYQYFSKNSFIVFVKMAMVSAKPSHSLKELFSIDTWQQYIVMTLLVWGARGIMQSLFLSSGFSHLARHFQSTDILLWICISWFFILEKYIVLTYFVHVFIHWLMRNANIKITCKVFVYIGLHCGKIVKYWEGAQFSIAKSWKHFTSINRYMDKEYGTYAQWSTTLP